MSIDWGSHPKHMDMGLVPQDPVMGVQTGNWLLDVVGMQVCQAKNGG